ncbi:hypothetical protein E9232_006327 [Inquilinus ginsengisoli]|uniref:Uncharacterized protein n=1 Tax=Inquilinus ginsengisoli TaxID=363840 RepID=A0ABU1K0F7_9PROT|nr:hypothetical protein [Inquilinus ginsengisoli]MDR6293774.1 hypothetical protein [Inquilinus ginsengisoli]
METQDRTAGDATIVKPRQELLINQLLAEGFFPEEVQDFVALKDAALLNLATQADCKRHLEALRTFRHGLTSPTVSMAIRIDAFEDFLLNVLRSREDEEDGDCGIDFAAHDRYLDAIYGPRPLRLRLYRFFCFSAPVLFIRRRVFGHLIC